MKATDRYGEALVLRVNELFYDLRNEEYDPIHEEMLGREGERWRRYAKRFLRFEEPGVVLDVGSGAGLVPMSIAGALRWHDRVICADLSAGMLEIARRNLSGSRFAPEFEFVKVDGAAPFRLPFGSASVDAVTMNSALHHIKETDAFLCEVDRVLKPGGLVMIGHEPNRAHYECRPLRMRYALLKPFFIPKNFILDLARSSGLYSIIMGAYYILRPARRRAARELMEAINGAVAEEKLFDRPLEAAELASITDIRDAEGLHGDRLFPDYELLAFETYHPLNFISIKHPHNPLIARYDARLARRHPREGATFFAVYRKEGMEEG